MQEFSKTKTAQAVMQVFVLETQAIQKYLWFAKVATKEGYHQIAAIFTETAEQKKSHTKTLFRYLAECEIEVTMSMKAEKIGTTTENLAAAIASETSEEEHIFAEAEKAGWDEGLKQIATKLKLFRQIKKFYASRFKILAENIENGTVFKKAKKVKWICRKCGLIYESERALKNCPGCEHPQAYFEILAENY